MLMGFVRLVSEYAQKEPICGEEDTRPHFVKNLHYLYYSIILFGLSLCVTVCISLLTKPIDAKHVSIIEYIEGSP